MKKIIALLAAVALLNTNVYAAAVSRRAAPAVTPLSRLNVQLAGASAPELVLNKAFDASVPRATLAAPVQAASLGGGTPSLPPSGPGSPQGSSEPPRPNRQAGMARGGVIAIIAGVAVVIGLVVALVMHNGNKQNELFEGSPANADVVLVEKAQRAGDANELDRLAEAAAQRQATLREQVADARSRGSKTLPDGTEVDRAAAYADFDGLVIARAELAENQATTDPKERVGLQLPATWAERVRAVETAALASGTEGALALELDRMRQELARQDKNRAAVKAQLDAYNGRVPTAGGRMGELSRKAAGELQAFDSGEVGAENRTLLEAEGKMRARVSDKLARTQPGFSQLQDRIADLDAVRTEAVRRHARAAEDDLREAQRFLKEARENDRLAKENERVEVKLPNGDVVVEDRSGPYKTKAAEAWGAAKAKKESAERSLRDMNAELRQLRQNAALQRAGLDHAVPSAVSSWFDHDELGETAGAVEATRRGLDRLDQGIAETLLKDKRELGRRIDEELARQKRAASTSATR